MTDRIKIAKELAKYFSIPINEENVSDHNWDGKAIYLENLYDYSHLIHEIAHWLVASKKRRKLPEFGLGDPNGFGITGDNLLILTFKKAQAEEERASAIGILAEKFLGFDWKRTYVYHNWNDDPKIRRKFDRICNSALAQKMKSACLSVKKKLGNKNI